MNPALRNQNVQENSTSLIASFNCIGLGSSREYVAELVKQYDLVALQETWLFPWDLAVPSTLGINVNSFSIYRPLMSLMGSRQDVHMEE